MNTLETAVYECEAAEVVAWRAMAASRRDLVELMDRFEREEVDEAAVAAAAVKYIVDVKMWHRAYARWEAARDAAKAATP